MEKVIERTIERINRLSDSEYLSVEQDVGGFMPEFVASDLKALLTEYQRTKKALELANEGLAHYADDLHWMVSEGQEPPRFYDWYTPIDDRCNIQHGNGYDKARETQKEIEKLLGGGE